MGRSALDGSNGTLAPVDFSTDGLPSIERFDVWRSQFGAVHDVEVDGPDRPSFEANGRNWRFGPVLIGVFRTPARRVIRTPRHLRRDDLDQVVIRVPRSCVISSHSDHGSILVAPGEVAIGSYANGYAEEHTAGEWVTAIFPRDAFPALRGRVPLPQVLKGTAAVLLADFLLSLPARLDRLPLADAPQVERIVYAMISACLAASIGDVASPPDQKRLVLRERVERIIAAHLASPRLTPGRIAGLAGVSRSALYRTFEAEGGIAAHILERRLDLIWRDLTAPDLAHLPIGRIAERRGLHNAASFHRAFRRQFGATPGDVRAARLGADTGGLAEAALPQDRIRFIDILRPAAR